jgi:hypothetical protein
MAFVFINSIEVCDTERNPLEFDEEFKAFLVPFSPKSRGSTGPLLLMVKCSLQPSSPEIEVRFVLKNLIPDYRFLMGDGEKISYFKQVRHNNFVFLEFNMANLKPIKECLLSRLSLAARDSRPTPDNEPLSPIRIKGF